MGLPVRDFDPAALDVTNDARRFFPFDPAALGWSPPGPEGEGARAAVGLGLHLAARPGSAPAAVPAALGPMTCEPARAARGGQVREQRLCIELEPEDLARVRRRLGVDRARVVYALTPDQAERLARRFEEHLDAGHLEALATPGFVVDRAARVRAADPLTHLRAWLAGESALLWRFTGLDRGAAVLLELHPGERLTLHAEVACGLAGSDPRRWWRVNPGLLLDALRDPGRDPLDARQDLYDALSERFTALVASGHTSPEPPGPGDLAAVSGGSLASVVLQPSGVVPPALFSFATCDPVRVFATRLEGEAPLAVRCCQPTLTREALARVWARHGVDRRERFTRGPQAREEFLTTDYAEQVELVPGAAVARSRAFHDDLGRVVGYGRAGWRAGTVPGRGTERILVPQAHEAVRPTHPRWSPDRALQLRRLYPLRYHLRLGGEPGAPELAITQDDVDCARQEHVFHLYWGGEGYYQSYVWRWTGQRWASLVHPTKDPDDANPDRARRHKVELDAAGRPVLPALGAGRALTVPRRQDFRPGAGGAYGVTRLRADAPALVQKLAGEAARYAGLLREALGRAAAGKDPGQAGLPAHAAALAALAGELVRGPDREPGTVAGVLQASLRATGALARLGALDPFEVEVVAGWRSPEHNEALGASPLSTHQLGTALDLRPRGAGEGERNPLALLCLHLAAQDAEARGDLRECRLELADGRCLLARFDERRAGDTVLEHQLPGGGGAYVLLAADGTEDPLADVADPDEEPPADPGKLDVTLARTLRAALDEAGAAAWPTPLPTYLDLYLLGLCLAAHVHVA